MRDVVTIAAVLLCFDGEEKGGLVGVGCEGITEVLEHSK